MRTAADLAVVLLAAGRGRRFGGDKLRAKLQGRPLVDHAAATLALLGFRRKIAVVGADEFDLNLHGFELVRPGGPDQSDSLRAGVRRAMESNPSGILIALGDVPFVSAKHIGKLIAGFDGERIASTDGAAAMPPAIFGPAWWDRLTALTGDRGAGALLAGAPLVSAAPHEFRDIDSPADL